MFRTSLSLVVLSLACLHSVNGVFNVKSCHKCVYYARNENSTENNADCLDSSKLGEAEPCKMDGVSEDAQPKHWQCVKVVGKIQDEDEENHEYIERACIPGLTYNTFKECKSTGTYETKYGFVKRGKHCACDDKDGCNTGNGLEVAGVAMAIGLLIHYVN